MRNKIVEIAKGEIGYKEQGNNITKYGAWYGMQDEWCAIFIGWLANEVGILGTLIPKMAYVPSMANWFKEKGKFKARGTYPQAGDIIFFDYNHNNLVDHVGIVEKCDGGVVTTIEGNKSNQVLRCTYNVNSNDIYGYGIPDYTDKENKGDEEEMKTYQNGSTVEPVYADTGLNKLIGQLNPYEKCDCYGIFENRAVVRYKVDGTNNYKVGFCKWTGGVK